MKRIITSAVFILIFCPIYSQIFEDEKNLIPPDFGKNKTHVVFQMVSGDPAMNKAVKKAFEKYYTGSFEIISQKEDKGKNHDQPDTKYYWFKVIWEPNYYNTDKGYSFGLREFNTFKVYQISYYSYTYGKILPAYVKKMEEVRKMNEENRD